MTRPIHVFAALLMFALVAPAALAQTRPRRVDQTQSPAPSENPLSEKPREEVGEDEVVRIDTTLVTIPVSIRDRNGRYIPDLRKEDFRVYENGVEQEVAYFAAVEKPFTVILMVDTSSSNWSKLSQIKDAALIFIQQLRSDDQVMVVSFARGASLNCEPTTDRRKIRKAIEGMGRGLSTHLYDAMNWVVQKHLNKISGRKAVVLFTDGVDAVSHHATYESSVREVEELDALIYPIRYDTYDPLKDTGGIQIPQQSGSRLPSILSRLPFPVTIGSGSGSAGTSRADYDRGERYLHDLAELTGGRVYEASRDLQYLQYSFTRIAEELRRQYSLGYYPKPTPRASERRSLKVLVNRPDLAVRARDSYIYKPIAAARAQNQPQTTNQPQTPGTAPVLKKQPLVRYD
ncbi:MAG TPA: VWA domain-containing protein [Pyrinomonadaceae bacterium]